jgi:hypothetical protein
MSQCKAITKNDVACSRNALKSGYCTQHDKDEKIRMYRKELAKMHERVRRYIEISNNFNTKFIDIQRIDYLKHELIKIGGSHTPFRAIIDNPCYKNQIEDLFDMPITQAHDEYNRLLTRRNDLVHPHTQFGWNRYRSR